MATAEAALAALESIARDMRLLVAHFGAEARSSSAPMGQGTVPNIASDRDLDGQYGNPEVKAKSPRDWTGESQHGKRFSECPPEYLDIVASRLDYFADQNASSQDAAEQKKVRYNRIDASRARGWAQRLRNGWKPAEPEPTADPNPMTADEIPFLWLLPALVVLHSAAVMWS